MSKNTATESINTVVTENAQTAMELENAQTVKPEASKSEPVEKTAVAPKSEKAAKLEKTEKAPKSEETKKEPVIDVAKLTNQIVKLKNCNGVILFDGDMEKVRIIILGMNDKQRKVLEDAKFFENHMTGSWNKKLTVKGIKAALEVAELLTKVA